jgi:L-threonylcarbamoyladenylate synthase
MRDGVDEVVRALREGLLAVIPTDTVYGLACIPAHPGAVRALSELKARAPEQPIALVAATVDDLVALIPELRESDVRITRALLPGAYTLVLPNPARRFPWLSGERRDTIGVRVPAVTGETAEVLTQVSAVAATSANLHGGPDPGRLDEVPDEILARAAAALDGGELPGTPSTVVDLTGNEPRVLREGTVPAETALAHVASALNA